MQQNQFNYPFKSIDISSIKEVKTQRSHTINNDSIQN